MEPVHLAFLWHQHQPFYKEIEHGGYILPWVRLHAIKDYIGLLLTLKEFPGIRSTVNMVPSLVLQIQEYADGKAVDGPLQATRKPAEELTESERVYALEHFFVGNVARLAEPFPRYRELLAKRRLNERSPRAALGDFTVADLRDLQMWATLSWFHPLVVETDLALKALRQKGRDFTEADKQVMLARQDEVICRVLPLHREMAQSGQIEISTTPFYHPILPLLCNMESAREAMPDVPMPDRRADLCPDAATQVKRAIEFHRSAFGAAPRGMWPAEGSVSQEILPLLAQNGIRWIATDEGVLWRSTRLDLSRDERRVLRNPDGLYQPYATSGGDASPAIVFRDRLLADSIGFEYHHGDNKAGADDFVNRVLEGARRCQGRPRLISVILDGENPWDYYPNAGLTFLRALFGRIEKEKEIVTTPLAEYLEKHPPEKRVEHLAAGSWIDSNFAIWIGSPQDRTAWSYVAEARNALEQRAKSVPPLDPAKLADAWEQLYVAEGSDWYWWFGEDRTSAQDYLFDELFRSHVRSVYRLIGLEPPAHLSTPIGKPPQHPAAPEADNPAMRRSQG